MMNHYDPCYAAYFVLIISDSYSGLFVWPDFLLRDCRVHLDFQDHQDLKETKYVWEKNTIQIY